MELKRTAIHSERPKMASRRGEGGAEEGGKSVSPKIDRAL